MTEIVLCVSLRLRASALAFFRGVTDFYSTIFAVFNLTRESVIPAKAGIHLAYQSGFPRRCCPVIYVKQKEDQRARR